MEKLFEVEEKYVYEDYLELNKYYMFSSKKAKISLVLIYLAIVLIALMSFYLRDYTYLVIALIFAIIYPIMQVFVIKTASKKSYKTNKLIRNTTQNIIFYEDYFEVVNEIGNTKIYYDKLHKIAESKNLFILFIAYNQAYIVKKSKLEDVQKFRTFIESKK